MVEITTDAMSFSDTGSYVLIRCDIHFDTVASLQFIWYLARDRFRKHSAWCTKRSKSRIVKYSEMKTFKGFFCEFVRGSSDDVGGRWSDWTENPNFYMTKVSSIYSCKSIL